MFWTKDEIEVIRKVYPEKGLKETKKILENRTENAILLKASELGIKLRKNFSRKIWTSDEVEKLKKHYPVEPKKKLLELFPDRNYNQIRQKARKLKIKRRVGLSFKGFKNLDLTEIQKAYLAGLFDGEGHLTLHRQKSGKYNYYTPELGISNTSMELMKYLINTLKKGGIPLKLYLQKKGKNKPVGIAHVTTHQDAYCFLLVVLPYLIVKKNKAKLIIEFIEKKANKEDTSQCLKELGYQVI